MGSNSASDMEVSKKYLNITRSHHRHSDASKMLMRRSAFQAGLIPDCDSSRLVLCLEPEGVCFTALFGPSPPTHWNSDDFVLVDDDYVEDCRSEGSRLADIMRVEGSRFMVLDAGGGTVDLSSYEVGARSPSGLSSSPRLREGPTGRPKWTSTFCNLFEISSVKRSPKSWRCAMS